MSGSHPIGQVVKRQYFEHPRCQVFRRANVGEGQHLEGDQHEQGSISSEGLDKGAPKKTLSPLLLAGLMYTYTICGAYAVEETVMGGGPLLAIISIILIPVFMAMPTALVVTEMATAIPSNAGFLMWVHLCFHRVVYFTMVIFAILLSFIDNALYAVLFSEYICTSVSCTTVTNRLLRAGMILVTFVLNLLGVEAVGRTSVMLSVVTVSPFLIMFTIFVVKNNFYLNWPALSYIPDEIDWATFLATASWNLCGLEQASTVAEDIKSPHRTIIRALVPLFGLAYLTYIPPILTGASVNKGPPDLSEWSTGYWSYVAESVGGKWLQIVMVVASAFSAFGLMLSSLCTTSQIIAGVAFSEVFPAPVSRILYQRNERFGTYHWTLTLNALVTCVFGVLLDFGPLVKTDQVLYGLRVVLIFMCFLIMRRKFPHLRRQFRVPLEGKKIYIFIFPMLLFVALSIVLLIEDMQTVIVNLSVLGGTILFSIFYCFVVRKEDFYGRVVTELLSQEE